MNLRPFWITLLAVVSIVFLGVALYMLLGTDKLPKLNDREIAQEQSGETTCQKKHLAFVFGYEFCYPENWELAEFGEDKEIVTINPNKAAVDPLLAPIAVTAHEDTSANLLSEIRSAIAGEVESRISLDGTDATQVIGSKNNGIQTIILASRDRYTFQIELQATNSNQYREEWDALLATWKWIDITSPAPVRSESGNIIVELPSYGSLVRTPLTLVGKARVFEAAFSYRLKDADGTVVVSGHAMTKGGDMSQLNPFSLAITFKAPASETGTIEVYSNSAKDGAEQDLTVVPIRFK